MKIDKINEKYVQSIFKEIKISILYGHVVACLMIFRNLCQHVYRSMCIQYTYMI